jgi:hypothetical protein
MDKKEKEMNTEAYILKIKQGDYSYQYIVDWVDEIIEDTDVQKNELKNLKGLTYNDVWVLNGEHLIYGAIECFEQSPECPYWYDRQDALYSWIKQ